METPSLFGRVQHSFERKASTRLRCGPGEAREPTLLVMAAECGGNPQRRTMEMTCNSESKFVLLTSGMSMEAQTLFGMPLLDTCPCGEMGAGQHVVFDEQANVWHRVCANCLQAEPPQRPN